MRAYRQTIIDQPLMEPCDPFWIGAQRKVATHVRDYARRQGLPQSEHERLLDILGLAWLA